MIDSPAGGTFSGDTTLELSGVGMTRDGVDILDGVDWKVDGSERWIVLGANGSGKTTLVRIASLYEHPSRGTVDLTGQRLGRTDVRRLRQRVALVSAALSDMIRPALRAVDVVMTARYAALEPWWHTYHADDVERARSLLDRQGVGWAADRSYSTLSTGERQRVLLARALMSEPALILLDEPSAGLDLGGREQLLDRLDSLARDHGAPPVVLVTHHVEEIPEAFTHLLGLHHGRVLDRGPIDDVLDGDLLSELFELPIRVKRMDGRWSARRS